MPAYVCESSCHSCTALHRKTGPLAPQDNHTLVKGHCFCSDCCFQSTALTLAVPCSPMPMVSSVSKMAVIMFAATQRVCALLTMCCMGTALM